MEKKKKPKSEKKDKANIRRPITKIKFDTIAIAIMLTIPLILYYKFLSGSRMLYGSDWLLGGLPNRKFMADYIRSHWSIALWQPHIYGGLPTVAAFFADLFYPTTLFRLFFPTDLVWTYTFIFHLFLAGLGTYLFLLALGIDRRAAFLSGIGYMMAGSLVSLSLAGHDGRLITSSLLPFVLYFLHKGITTKRFSYFIFSGTIIGLQLFSGHIQKVYYTGIIVVFYFIFQIIFIQKGRERLKLLLYFIIMFIYVGLLTAIQYLPVYGNLPYVARGGEKGYAFATSWSMPPEETFDLITPHFSGILDHYWGRNYFKLHTEYLGILPLLLSLLAIIFKWKEKIVKFFFFFLVFGLLMAFGGYTPFYYLPYYSLPGISKFRGPGMIFFTCAFSIMVLAGFGLHYLIREIREKEVKRLKKVILWFSGVIGVLLILSLIASGLFLSLGKSLLSPLLPEYGSELVNQKINTLYENYGNFRTGLLLAFFFAAISSLLLYYQSLRKLSLKTSILLLASLLFIDLWRVDRKYIRDVEPPKVYYAPDEVINFLKSDTTIYRVFPLQYERSDNGILTLYDIQSVGGHHPNPLSSYQEFIGAEKTVMFQPTNLIHKNFLDLLNVKYIISVPLPQDISPYDPKTQNLIRELKDFFSQENYELVFSGSRNVIYQNKSSLPRAFLVSGYKVVKDKEEIFSLLKGNFDPRKVVLLSDCVAGTESLSVSFPVMDTIIPGEVSIKKYSPNRIEIETKTELPGFLVLSENYHPDWQALIDNQKTKIYRAYHTFRAIWLPKGAHNVVFIYASKYYRIGSLFTIIGLIFFVGIGFLFLKGKKI